MAIFEVKVPQLSESVAEASLLTWHKQVGEAVSRDENLIDLETDKVVLELPAPNAGVVTKIVKGNGEKVVAGEVIALIDSEAVATVLPEKKAEAQSVLASDGPVRAIAADSAAIALQASEPAASDKEQSVAKPDVPAAGTLIAPLLQPVPVTLEIGARPEDRVPMSRLRARIAERLVQSHLATATLTTFNEVDMQAVIDLRNKYKDKFGEEHGVRLGFMSFFVKAAVAALKKYPIINASIDGSDIVYHGYFDIGIAIGSPRGLVVPVIRNADQMSIADIERQINTFSVQASAGHLTLEDLTGGTFSISNGGVFGSMLSTPIINPPQSAILGIHATKDRAVVIDGQIVIRPINYLALSYDHRLIDGREAVQALVAIKDAMEDPARLLLDI